jgi:uncharacterized repeat protein (TIGR03803 family)
LPLVTQEEILVSEDKLSMVSIAMRTILTLTALLSTLAAAQTETTLYSFNNTTDGNFSTSGLVFDAAGNLYGTNPYAGAFGLGEVFELSPAAGGGWTETTLHSFNTSTSFSNLIFDAAGHLYGASYSDGTYGCGTVFELAKNHAGLWNEKVLHNFTGARNDGCLPLGGLLVDSAGNLYGTTDTGGTLGAGVRCIQAFAQKWRLGREDFAHLH